MGNREDALKSEIENKFGSVPKFSEAAGIPKSTIYNIFDRGVVNTRTKTMELVYAALSLDEDEEDALDDDEAELVEMFRKMNGKQRAAILETARAMVC